MKCELCQKNDATQKHHLIPQCVVQKINPASPLKSRKINLCDPCHKEIHNCLILHIEATKNYEPFTKIEAMRYKILKDYMKTKYPTIFDEWKKIYTEMIKEESLKVE